MSGRRLMFEEVEGTWNPCVGCTHNCVYCYARILQQTRLNHLPQYKDFEPKLVMHKLQAIPNKSIVLIVAMGDLFCNEMRDEWIEAVLIVIYQKGRKHQTFYFLTKNPIRYLDWLDWFEELDKTTNIALGITIETDLDYSHLKTFISNAPSPIARLYIAKYLRKVWNGKLFISIEPILQFTPTFHKELEAINPDWVVIGYDNHRKEHKRNLPEPKLWETMSLISNLEKEGIEVKKKTIWKQEFF